MTPEKLSAACAAVQWSKLNFKLLEVAWQNRTCGDENPHDQAKACRYESIMQIVESDRFWPPVVGAKRAFVPSLCEVLARLPEREFEYVDSNVGFVLEDVSINALAINVSLDDFSRVLVFYRACWKLSHQGLVGLIAHEIAHYFVDGKNYGEDEALANALARSWGFGEELENFRS